MILCAVPCVWVSFLPWGAFSSFPSAGRKGQKAVWKGRGRGREGGDKKKRRLGGGGGQGCGLFVAPDAAMSNTRLAVWACWAGFGLPGRVWCHDAGDGRVATPVLITAPARPDALHDAKSARSPDGKKGPDGRTG